MDEQNIYDPNGIPVPSTDGEFPREAAEMIPDPETAAEEVQQTVAENAPEFPEQPQFHAPEQPAWQPEQPQFQPQEQPVYQQPQQPQYQAPQQPAWQPEQPQYQAPQQPAWQPEQPRYQAPQQPVWQPQYQPPQQPQYQQPQSPYQQQFSQYQAQQPDQASQYRQQFAQYQNQQAQYQQPQQPYGQPGYQQVAPQNYGYSYAQPGAPVAARSFPVVQLIFAAIAFITFFVIRMIDVGDTFRVIKYAIEDFNVNYSLTIFNRVLSAWSLYLVTIALTIHLIAQYRKGRTYSLGKLSFAALGISQILTFAVGFLTVSVIIPAIRYKTLAHLDAETIVLAALYLITAVLAFAAAGSLNPGKGKGACITASVGYIVFCIVQFIMTAISYSDLGVSLPALQIVGFISELLIGAALLIYSAMLQRRDLNVAPAYYR